MMHALKTPSFLRPASRPASPVPTPPSRPDSGLALERMARPRHRLSFSGFRRPSPAALAAPATIPAPLVQDGSYLEALSLRFSEAVSKALAQPTGPAGPNEALNGKRVIPPGRGHALGVLIASELKATRDNPHLYRAIQRSLHRPLSVLLSNLSAHLLPLTSSAAFLTPSAPANPSFQLNPTQIHALALAGFAGELLEHFDELGIGLDADVRGDGLKTIRDGLVSLIGRVVNPLMADIKKELLPLIDALEKPVSTPQKATAANKPAPVLHPSIHSLQGLIPIYARVLPRYTVSITCQAGLATLLISIVWRALVALSHRPHAISSPRTTPPGSPVSAPGMLKKQATMSVTSPPATPPSTRFTIKLPPSRPPSPPSAAVFSTPAADARALYDLLDLLPRPPADKDATHLAREAVDEAYADLKALAALLENMESPFFTVGKSDEDLMQDLDTLTDELPTLIALPVLLRAQALGGDGGVSIPAVLQIADDEYRKGCLAGFGRAEECSLVVGQRVLEALQAAPNKDEKKHVIDWLDSRLTAGDH